MSTDVHELLDRAALAPSRPFDVATVLGAAHRRVLRRRAALVGAPLIAIVLLVGAAGSSSFLSGPATPRIETRTPPVTATKGTMPNPMPTLADGSVDRSRVPDFISTVDRNGEIVGYVKVEELIGRNPTDKQTVFGDDLTTVVGHMYAGRGFVPVGQDPASVPRFASTTTVDSMPPQP